MVVVMVVMMVVADVVVAVAALYTADVTDEGSILGATCSRMREKIDL